MEEEGGGEGGRIEIGEKGWVMGKILGDSEGTIG